MQLHRRLRFLKRFFSKQCPIKRIVILFSLVLQRLMHALLNFQPPIISSGLALLCSSTIYLSWFRYYFQFFLEALMKMKHLSSASSKLHNHEESGPTWRVDDPSAQTNLVSHSRQQLNNNVPRYPVKLAWLERLTPTIQLIPTIANIVSGYLPFIVELTVR